MIGRVIKGKYRILQDIGIGQAGTAYLAMNLSGNEVVVLRVLPAEPTQPGQFLVRVREEATRLQKLDSRYVMRILDYGEEQGLRFIVQEYTPGRPLEQVLHDEGPLAVGRTLSIAQQIAQCLADTSSVGLTHQNLSPASILLGAGDVVKVMDFGLAAGTGPIARRHYLSPELAAGQPADIRADIYSLGVILFEMLTGQVPYPGEEAITATETPRFRPVPSVRRLGVEVSEGMDALLAKCLATDPQERPLPLALAGAISDLLEEAAEGPGMEGSLVGQTLGHYQLLGRIGRGGMATVYKAYQPGLDRYVAVKVLPTYLSHDPRFAGRFAREARAIARLKHPNILPVYDFGQEGDLSYIVMQFVEAGTLKEMLGQPLSLALTADIISQVAAALDDAHSQGMVHRDVKPSNVLMAKASWALLSDFGLARMVESGTRLTKTGASVGTPTYMSPEQGKGLTVDARSDVYSLGVVLYEMLTGHVPYEAETPLAVLVQHITAPLPRPRESNPAIPEPVERVILKAIAKEPVDRFQSAGEMAAALKKAVEESRVAALPQPPTIAEMKTRLDLPVTPAPVTIVEERREPSAVPWLWIGAGLLGLFFLAAMGLMALLLGRTLGGETEPTPTPLALGATVTRTVAATSPSTSPPSTLPLTAVVQTRQPADTPLPPGTSATATPVRKSLTPTNIPTATARPVTSTPDLSARMTAEMQRVATAVAETLTAQPPATFTPTESPTPTVTSTLAPTSTPTPVWKWIAGASKQFSNVQGKDHWYYMVEDATGYHDMPWTPEDQCWQWGYPQEKRMDYVKLKTDGGHAGPGVDSVRVWESSVSGLIRIQGVAHKYAQDGSLGGDGVNVAIKKNRQVLWQAYIGGRDTRGKTYDLTTDIRPGDRLYFQIDINNSPEYDGTFFDPAIYVRDQAKIDSTPASGLLQDSNATPPACYEYVGSVDGYSDYGGVAIEVRVLNRDGKPVPGVLVRTHAFNTDFTDITGSDGAFRRDGFSQPITWEVSLPKERARPLNVKLEWQKLAVATFRLQPCK